MGEITDCCLQESACSVGDQGSIPGSGRSPGEGNGYPLQFYCLKNPMDSEAWQAGSVHEAAKSWKRLSNQHFHICMQVYLHMYEGA